MKSDSGSAPSAVRSTPLVKAEAREMRRQALTPVKARRKEERVCFWTWRWGHVWKTVETIYAKRGGVDLRRCQSCGKTKASLWP